MFNIVGCNMDASVDKHNNQAFGEDKEEPRRVQTQPL